MFDKIVFMGDKSCNIKLKDPENITTNLMNLHLIFEDDKKRVLGEVDNLDGDLVTARFLGEIVDNKVVAGTVRKPAMDATVRVIKPEEIPMVCGQDTDGFMELGVSPFYDGFPVFLDVNSFFSNHFAIFGNTGSGKSCGTTRLFQNMFHDKRLNPYKANIFLFDSSGEYYNAFSNLSTINPNFHYRLFTTNENENIGEKLRLPIYLCNASDLALLLQCTSHSQLPIIERMLKLALIFSQKDVDAVKYQNHLIAKAIMTILYTNETSPNKRNEVFSILASCSTPQFNLEAPVQGIGYTRKFRECFLINNDGQFSESVLLTEYVTSFINDKFDEYEPETGVYYDLNTLERALNFTLISEGWLRNETTYGDAVTIRVRLHALIVGPNSKYFEYKNLVTLEDYLSSLILDNGRKYQIININLDDVDDDFAKVIVKIYSRLIFDFSKALKNRASIPFHIVVEEAHRYIQNDTDRFLIGYNIFERIAKEGRKYGVILGLISQRPVELSDTVISQCNNFLIFKISHPVDVEYIRKMLPNISDEIVEKQKTLQSGTCLGFGLGFRIPLIVRMKMPNPAPWSGNANIVEIWKGNTVNNVKGQAEVDMNLSMGSGIQEARETTLVESSRDFVEPGKTIPETGNGVQLVNIKGVDEKDLAEAKNDIEKEVPTTDSGVPLVNIKTNNDGENVSLEQKIDIPTTDSGVPLVSVNTSATKQEVKEEKTIDEEPTTEQSLLEDNNLSNEGIDVVSSMINEVDSNSDMQDVSTGFSEPVLIQPTEEKTTNDLNLDDDEDNDPNDFS